ncbi:MAG: hypothetical protein H7Z17_12500 [Fuerstia sp.]|nr:hypothetical protein [Fuerstiella sp.]
MRSLVVLRKITFGHCSDTSATRMARLMTVTETAKRHGHRLSDIYYYRLFTQPPGSGLLALRMLLCAESRTGCVKPRRIKHSGGLNRQATRQRARKSGRTSECVTNRIVLRKHLAKTVKTRYHP